MLDVGRASLRPMNLGAMSWNSADLVRVALRVANTEPYSTYLDALPVDSVDFFFFDHNLCYTSDVALEEYLGNRLEARYHPTSPARMETVSDGVFWMCTASKD